MSPLGIILLIVVILIIFGGIGGPYVGAPWRPYYGAHPAPFGIVGLILIILVVWLLFGGIGRF